MTNKLKEILIEYGIDKSLFKDSFKELMEDIIIMEEKAFVEGYKVCCDYAWDEKALKEDLEFYRKGKG